MMGIGFSEFALMGGALVAFVGILIVVAIVVLAARSSKRCDRLH
jgi:hypothetical protein